MKRELSFKKGDKCIIAIVPRSNASRGVDMSLKNISKWTYEGKIISIGRKYITVKLGWGEKKFVIEDDYKEKYTYGTSNYKLYSNLNEVIEEKESEELNDYIRYKIGDYGKPRFTLDQLRRIKAIVDEGK